MHFLEYLTKETFRLGEWFDVYNYSQYGEKVNGGKEYVINYEGSVKHKKKGGRDAYERWQERIKISFLK